MHLQRRGSYNIQIKETAQHNISQFTLDCSRNNMSKHVNQNKEFLRLLLTTSRDQAAALVDTITPAQVLLLSEIAFNALQLPLSKKTRSLVDKKKKLFEDIASKTKSKEQKTRLIRKNYKPLLTTLWALKPQLMLLL